MRLDIYLTKNFDIQSRNKAQELIKANKVKINDKIITKASYKVEDNDNIELLEDDFYVSRAAYKLRYFMEEAHIDVSGKLALDIGSSTGGFTQILLNNQIKNVSISASGELAFTTAQREDSIVWKTKTGDIKFRSPNRYTNYTASTFSEDESYISVGTFQGEIKRWNIKTGKETGKWQATPRKAYGGAASKAISSIVDTKKKITVLTSDGLTQTFKP